MSVAFDSMTLILPQIKFEAVLSKDVGGVAFQVEAYVLHQILGICHNIFFLVAHMALILKILDFQRRDLSNKCILFPSQPPPPPPPPSMLQVMVKCMKMYCDTPILLPAFYILQVKPVN